MNPLAEARRPRGAEIFGPNPVSSISTADAVHALLAIELVVPAATVDGIVAGPAIQDVSAVIAHEEIRAAARVNALDVANRVVLAALALAALAREPHDDACSPVEVRDVVPAFTTVEHVAVDAERGPVSVYQPVVPLPALEHIPPAAAAQRLTEAAAAQPVVPGPPDTITPGRGVAWR